MSIPYVTSEDQKYLTSDQNYVSRKKYPVDPHSRKSELTKTLKISSTILGVGIGGLVGGVMTTYGGLMFLLLTTNLLAGGTLLLAGLLVMGGGVTLGVCELYKRDSTELKLSREFERIELE